MVTSHSSPTRLAMALGTIRANKMRSALTVLGVVIGITAIVGMSSIIRGFDDSFRDMIRELGPNTIIVARASSFASAVGHGPQAADEAAEPDDRRRPACSRRRSPRCSRSAAVRRPGSSGCSTGTRRRSRWASSGSTEDLIDVNFVKIEQGRFFTENEVLHRRNVVVLGQTPYKAFFENTDPIGKVVRIGTRSTRSSASRAPRPSIGGLANGQDAFAIIPHTTSRRRSARCRAARTAGSAGRSRSSRCRTTA